MPAEKHIDDYRYFVSLVMDISKKIRYNEFVCSVMQIVKESDRCQCYRNTTLNPWKNTPLR